MDDDGFAKVLKRQEKKIIKDAEIKERRKKEAEQHRAAKAVQSARKRAAEEAKTKRSQFRFLDLPRECHDKAYIYCFSRPTSIEPTFYRHETKGPKDKHWKESMIYKYRWEGSVMTSPDAPWEHPNGQHVVISWTTKATEAQLATIEKGEWAQPKEDEYPQKLASGQVLCWANRRAKGNYDILHKQVWQIQAEASKILYGETRFVFNTAAAYRSVVYQYRCGDPYEKLLPFVRRMDERMMPEEVTQFLRMATQRGDNPQAPTFITSNPMFTFARAIGRKNFSLIRNIKLEGGFKTADFRHTHGHVGLSRALPYYTLFLNKVCDNLRELTLNVNYTHPNRKYGQGQASLDWDDDCDDYLRRTDDERINEMVGKVVAALPNLRKLRLGEYHLHSEQDPGKQNFVAPYNKAEAKAKAEEVARKNNDGNLLAFIALFSMFSFTPPAITDGKQGPDEWEAALHHIKEVKERERARFRRLRELPVGACLEGN